MHAPSENGWNLNKTPQTQTQYISIQEENTGRRADLMNVKLNIYRMCSFCPAANQNEDASLCQRCKMSRPISRRSTEKNPSNILFLGPQTNTLRDTWRRTRGWVISSVNSYRKFRYTVDTILRLYFLTDIHSTIYFILHSTAILFYKSEKDYIKKTL